MADIIDLQERILLAQLREWRCLDCEHVHRGAPSDGEQWRWCPKCGASSRRTHFVCISPTEAMFRDDKLKQVAKELTSEMGFRS